MEDTRRSNNNKTRDNSVVIEGINFRNNRYKPNLHGEIRTAKLTLYSNENKIEKDYESLDIEELYKNEDYERMCESFMDKYFLSEGNKYLVSEIIKLRYFIAKKMMKV